MDINKNQQINTFSKGMNTDVANSFIPADQYRLAENLRYTKNGDAGTLSTIEGYKRIEYATGKEYYLIPEKVLATTSIRNIGIVVFKGLLRKEARDDSDTITWTFGDVFPVTLQSNEAQWDGGFDVQEVVYICKFDKDSTNDLQNPANMDIVFGPCTDSEWLGKSLYTDSPYDGDAKLSLVANWESDNNVKLYIADGRHQLLSFNIFGPVYESITNLNSYVSTNMRMPKVEISPRAGTIKAGVVQYCYRFYNQNAQATNISPLSAPLNICNVDMNTYKGLEYDQKSNIATDITIAKNELFERIILYRILYEQYQQQPTVDIVYDGPATENIFKFTDTGRVERSMSAAELLAINSLVQFKPAAIERKNNYLFAANVSYEQDDIDYIFEHSGFKLEWKIDNSKSYVINKNNEITLGQFRKSLRRGEKYRYGVVYYTNTGRKSSVMNIVDIDLADQETMNNPERYVDQTTQNPAAWNIVNNNYEIHPIGIEFTLNIESTDGETYRDALNLISGYEIVRCERTYEDKRNLYQGILGTTVAQDDDDDGDSQYYTPGFMSNVYYNIASTREKANNYWAEAGFVMSSVTHNLIMYAFPELLYNRDETENVLRTYKNNLHINIVDQYLSNFTNSNDLALRTDKDDIFIMVTNQENGDRATLDLSENDELNGAYLKAHTVNFSSFDDLKKHYLDKYLEEGEDNDRISQIFENDLWPILKIQNNDANIYNHESDRKYNIQDIKIANSPDYNTYSNGETVRFKNDVQVVNNLQFINWTPNVVKAGDAFGETMHFAQADSWWYGARKTNAVNTANLQPAYPIATGGTCVVAYLDNSLPTWSVSSMTPFERLYGFVRTCCVSLPIVIANITKDANPYGPNYYSNVFYSHGSYRAISIGDKDTFTYSVFDGDCYIGIFEYNAAHCWDSAFYRATMMNTTYYVPIESDINLFYTHGDLKSRDTLSGRSYLIQDKAVIYHEYNQSKDAYLYNMVYSTEPNLIPYTKTEYTKYQSSEFDTRVLYSNQKENGELIDNWLQFKSANFIDVDTRYGKITNLRLFKDYLLYWQTDATGVLSVNERTILQDANEHNIILGNGDVLQRYDYITTQYGMREGDFSDTQSGTALYWWDSNKKDIVMYQGGQQVQPLKKVKSVSKYIDDKDGRDNPVLSYDNDHNEVICNVLSDNKSIVYGELMQQFMSIYDYNFDHKIQFNDRLLMFTNISSGVNMYKWNSVGSEQEKPKFIYVVNDNCTFPKSFDIMTFGGKFGDGPDFKLRFTSQLNMDSGLLESKYQGYDWNIIHTGTSESDTISIITDKEGDYRMAIPRGAYIENGPKKYGSRMRGKWMQCEIDSNSADFQLDYIITKYRMSWS